MANRHLSRSIVLQSLFEWDFNGRQNETIIPILKRNETEFGPGLDDFAFIEALADLVLQKQKIIDDIITKAAPDWPLDKISAVDRNILRIGLAELLFGNRDEVPPKVAINESIELAKAYGGETSSKFINGVLGAVYKEIGEPGKEQTSKRKKDETPIDISKLPIEKKAGAVIYTRHEGVIYFALVHDVFGYWTLSKGGVEDGEDEAVAVIREIHDEIGLSIIVKKKLGQNEYIASHPEKGKIRKEVHYFLTESPFQELALHSSGGLDDAKWFSLSELADIKTYDDILPLLAESIEFITKK